MADWRGSVVVRERDKHTKGPGFESGLGMSFFLVEKLSIIVQKFSMCLKNSNDRLRKGKLYRRYLRAFTLSTAMCLNHKRHKNVF